MSEWLSAIPFTSADIATTQKSASDQGGSGSYPKITIVTDYYLTDENGVTLTDETGAAFITEITDA